MTYPEPVNAVRLVVNGHEYGGWKSVRIETGIERQARSFDLEVTDRWPGQTDIPRRIQPGDPCQVFIGQDLVMTGYVDGTPIRYDGKSVGVGVKGRSKTVDLVDCCPIESGKSTVSGDGGTWKDVIGPDGKKPNVVKAPATAANQWRNQKMEVIAAAMAAPYDVRVIAEVDTGKVIPEHHVQVGETVFESVDRMMRLRHVLSTDNEKGDLVFIDVGSAGRAGTALELGKNIMSGSTELDYKGVFSEYIVKGQRAGNDEQYGADVSEEEGDADDYSPATVTGETATATDWRQEDGTLWLPNMMVRVRDGLIGFDTDMVIAEAAWILDKEGFRTEIKVGPPDGYRTKAGKLKASKSQKGGGPEWSDVK